MLSTNKNNSNSNNNNNNKRSGPCFLLGSRRPSFGFHGAGSCPHVRSLGTSMFSTIFRQTGDAALKRKRQIDTLKIFNANVTELQEDVEYQVEFTSGGNNMAILVSLGPDFPLAKPVLKVTPEVIHPWVNSQSEITGAPGLVNFTVHSDLGRVVQAIIREFERNPPPLASDGAGSSNMQTIGPDAAVTDGRVSPPYAFPMYPPASVSVSGMPPLNSSQPVRTSSAAFPELTGMTNDELKKLSDSEDRLDDFIAGIPQTVKMNKTIEDLMTKNEELAKETISKQPTLETLKHIVRKKLEAVAALKTSFELHSVEYRGKCEKYAPQNIKECLRLAAVQSDEDSERIAEQFLGGLLDVDQFVTSYVAKRMLSYSRKTKEEKLSSQLKELQRAGY